MRAVTKHYIGGEFVESHGREVMESVNPSNGEVLGHVTLGDAEDARRAIATAKKAFPAYSRTTKEERSRYLRRLHEAVSARAGDLTAVMIEEYGGTRQFSEASSARAATSFYFLMKYEVARMQKPGKGSIVNLASIAGLNGIRYAGPYASTKHAVVGLTKSAALDHATAGVRVNAVAPGAIKTDILAKQLEGGDPNYNEASISAMHPMNRLGRPEEIANGICFLLSDEASFVTGHILNIDGGFQAK
jgi:NAD(P)-dependent dehydrogenase (short-subunit alcohol dehydrogenase family)